MTSSVAFAELLRQAGITFFSGVPDSVLRGLCVALDLRADIQHVPAANEGAAVGLAVGWHLASGELPAIYLQASGLWNALNPYLSLAHQSVYDIPLLFIVGWRGRPRFSDEPQHMISGAETEGMLRMMGISPFVFERWDDEAKSRASQYLKETRANGRSAAFLVPLGVFDQGLAVSANVEHDDAPTRSEVIEAILPHIDSKDFLVAGIGHTGRALYAARRRKAIGAELMSDFLCVGGMGYALQVAIGASLRRPERPVWCFEGDGAFLMHMGTAAVVGTLENVSVVYVLLDNGAHASVGGQKTASHSLDYGAAARTLGFRDVESAHTIAEVQAALGRISVQSGPRFLWVKIRNEPALKLPRPEEPLSERKRAAMELLGDRATLRHDRAGRTNTSSSA